MVRGDGTILGGESKKTDMKGRDGSQRLNQRKSETCNPNAPIYSKTLSNSDMVHKAQGYE